MFEQNFEQNSCYHGHEPAILCTHGVRNGGFCDANLTYHDTS